MSADLATSAVAAVTMQDLALEHAELLPRRETLYCCTLMPSGGLRPPWRE
jgi:hypothetical protein